MKVLFRPITKKEASKVILLLARILKVVFLIAAFGSAFAILVSFTSEMGFFGLILGLIAGSISFFLIMLSALLTESLLVGASVVFENHYNDLKDKNEKTIKELFDETIKEDAENF